MSGRSVFGNGIFVGLGAVCSLGLAAVVWAGSGAEVAPVTSTDEPVRLHDGYGYVPHDPSSFDALADGLAALPDAELA
ncbi:hypothetical protein N9W17_06340, partial [Jannaschia sp.]|nr:hypothetical protein [Jannaschia sp.]